MITEVATSNEPDASRRAGIQKRAKNLAAEELFIEVIGIKGKSYTAKQGDEHSNHRCWNNKKIIQSMMFGWGSAFLLSLSKKKG